MAKNTIFNTLQKQGKAGTLKQGQRDILQKQIDQFGIDKVKKGLQNTEVPISSGIKQKTNLNLGNSKVKGFKEGQVGIPGVNVLNKPNKIGSINDNQKRNDIIQKDNGIITTKINDVNPTGSTGVKDYANFDTNKDGIINENELSGDYKTFYDNLSDVEKKGFIAAGENAMKNNLDITESYTNYMRDYNTTKGRLEENQDYKLKQDALSGEAADIQENQTIRRSKASVDKLKQSIAYLGSQGMPGVSAQRITSLSDQITEADKSLSETKRLLSLSKSARKLGNEQKALQYERQMEDITTKLNDNVDKSIQDAFNSMISADNNGQLDTVEELTSFRDKMYQDLDKSITGFTDASIDQLRFLINRVDVARKEAITYEQNTNSVNSEMSSVKGYYINDNGSPIYNNKGTTIKIPTGIPKGFEPFISNGKFFSPQMGTDGELVKDKDGNPIFNSTQLEDEVSVTSQLATSYINAVNNGVMTPEEAIKAVPELATNENFINGIKSTPESKKVDTGTWKQAKDGRLYNNKTGKFATDIGETDSNISSEDAVIGDYQLSDGTTIRSSKGTVDGLNKVMALNPDIQFDLNNLYRTQEDQYRIYGQGRSVEELQKEGVPTEYSDMSKPIVSWSTKSSHMVGNAVDVVVPEGQDKVEYTKSIEKAMNDNGFFRPEDTLANGDYGHFQYKGIEKPIELTTTDIATFNNATFKPSKLKTDADKQKYKLYQEKLDKVFNDPYSNFYDIINLSKGSGKGSVSERDKVGKYGQVLAGLDTLAGLVNNQETGPVAGRLMQLNPYSTDVAEFKAIIAGLVPTVARGVFSEVGVLTDSDVNRYLGTLPTLEKTKDQNKLVISALLETLSKGMKAQLDAMARSDVDVSKFSGKIKKMDSIIKRLQSNIGLGSKEEVQVKGNNLGSLGAGIGASLGTGKNPVINNIDTLDKGFFNTEDTNISQVDSEDLDFFNNLK